MNEVRLKAVARLERWKHGEETGIVARIAITGNQYGTDHSDVHDVARTEEDAALINRLLDDHYAKAKVSA